MFSRQKDEITCVVAGVADGHAHFLACLQLQKRKKLSLLYSRNITIFSSKKTKVATACEERQINQSGFLFVCVAASPAVF